MARARVCHQVRELILTNFLTVFSLVYPEEGSIAETSVKIVTLSAKSDILISYIQGLFFLS